MESSEFEVRSSEFGAASARSVPRGSAGFTYMGLLGILVILGISMGAAGKYWSNVMLREKEAELLFRGDQYRLAIEAYYRSTPPGRIPQYPPSIDDLLSDNRTAQIKRHLRQRYKDPMTGEDFDEIYDMGHRIIGVHSKSSKTPLKQANFPDEYPDFAGKDRYSDWLFASTIKAGPAAGAPNYNVPPLPPPALQPQL